jgi:hypothetical protein
MIMRRQGLVWLAAAVLAFGAAACFSDPTKSLRTGATRLSLAQNTLTLHTGDSASVQGLVYDDQGNELTLTGATWSSTDAAVATVRPDTANPIPGDAYTRGVVKAVAGGGGVTTVVLAFGSLTDTLRVTVLPAVFPGTVTVIGTAGADTVIAPPAPTVIFSAGDTLIVNSSALMTFSATTSTVSFGPDAGYILSRSATQIRAMARRGYVGPVTITNVTFAGNAATGPIAVASINTSSISIQQAHFHGVAAVVGDTITLTASAGSAFSGTTGLQFSGSPATIFSQTATTIQAIAPILSDPTYTGGFTVYNLGVGAITEDSAHSTLNVAMNRATFGGAVAVAASGLGANTVMTVTAPTGTTFTTGASGSAVVFGSTTGTVLSRTATQIQAISTANVTNTVKVTKLILGTATIDSLRTAGNSTIAASFFPGTIANGNGRLLDTMVVLANGTGTFTTGAGPSNVTINGLAAFVLRRTTDSMLVIAKKGGTAKVSISNFVLAGPLTVPSLNTSANVSVDSITTDEPNEPGNQAGATATAVAGIVNIGDSVFVYGAMDGQSDQRDHYKFTMPAAGGTVTVTLTWFGTGAGTSDANADFDVTVCTALAASGSHIGQCYYTQDLIPGNAASGSVMPETGTSTAIAGSATVYVRTFSYYATANAGEHTYQLKIKTQ